MIMSWTTFSRICDILGFISFFLSIGILKKVYAKTESQKETCKNEREELLCSIIALRQNIWDDGLLTSSIQDNLQSKIYEFQMKYSLISSLRCSFHLYRCSHLLKSEITESSKRKIRQDINFLIARLNKKE